MNGIDIFNYSDYRVYLKDKVEETKTQNARFSYRMFNRLAGLKSSAHLKLVMDGKKNLGDAFIYKFTRGFKLGIPEAHYFEHLVKFNQAKTHEEKERYLKRVLSLKRNSPSQTLTLAQYELYSHWYYVAILEIMRLSNHTGINLPLNKKNLRYIYERLNPSVPLLKIKKAFSHLQTLGFIEVVSGKLQRKEAKLSTPDLVQSVAVANFHAQMSAMAARAVREAKAGEREFSSLTISVSANAFQKAKEEIQAFRKRLHSILEDYKDDQKTKVAQINLQLFLLSKGQ